MKKSFAIVAVFASFVALTAFSLERITTPANESLLNSNYHDGWNDGHCEGWKDEKGKNAFCLYPPYPPYPKYPKSVDSYRDGYNDGFKRGISDARK